MSNPTTTASGFSFGISPATTTAPPSFSFGSPASTNAPQTAPLNLGAQTTNPPATGSFSFGSTSPAVKPATTATVPKLTIGTPAPPSTVAATTTPSLFGTATTTSALPSGTLFGALTATTAAAAPTNFSFTNTPGSVTNTGATPVSVAKATTGQINLTTVTKTTESSAVSIVPTTAPVSYNQLEEYVNKWTLELEEQEKVFLEQASQINAWDQLLISNNQKILELNVAVQKVKAEQETLEQELEFISTQHTELEESIAPLQKEFSKIPQMDVERTQVYMTVESLDTQLKQMSEDLKEVIVNLNESNKCQDQSDPIIQIGKILNAHMSSLQWIENTSSNVSTKLEDLSKMHESFKRDSERSFRSAYYN